MFQRFEVIDKDSRSRIIWAPVHPLVSLFRFGSRTRRRRQRKSFVH